MIATLVRKELLQAARDRVVVASGAGLLVALGASLYLNAADFRLRMQQYRTNQRLHAENAAFYNSYRDLATTGVVIDQQPDPLFVFVNGVLDDLPPSVTISLGTGLVNDTDFKLVQNQWRRITGEFDFAFLAVSGLSLFGILLSYGAIAGERERGTLRLMLVNPVSRAQIFAAKLLAPWLILSLPIAAMLCLGAASFRWLTGMPIQGADLARLACIGTLALLYAEIFVAVGIWLSAVFRRPPVVLAAAVAAWAGLVFVVPSAALVAASLARPIPSRETVMEQKRVARGAQWVRWSQRHLIYEKEHGHAAHYDVSGDWLLDREFGTARELGRIDVDYETRVQRQIDFGVLLGRLSPAFTFHHAASTFAGSGLSAYRAFSDSVQQYRRAFAESLWTLVKQDPAVPDPGASIDLSVLPAFVTPSLPVDARVRTAAIDIGVLAAFLATAVAMGAVAFTRATV
jgi:ABC-2 type transport system permease protein